MPMPVPNSHPSDDYVDVELTDREFLIVVEAVKHCPPQFMKRVELDNVYHINSDRDIARTEEKLTTLLETIKRSINMEYIRGVSV